MIRWLKSLTDRRERQPDWWDIPSEEHIWAAKTLVSGKDLSDEEAARIIPIFYKVLCDADPELLWDDTYDMLDWMTPKHTVLVPHLYRAIAEDPEVSGEHYFAKCWAIHALGKIGGPEAIEYLRSLEKNQHPKFRNDIRHALKKCGGRSKWLGPW